MTLLHHPNGPWAMGVVREPSNVLYSYSTSDQTSTVFLGITHYMVEAYPTSNQDLNFVVWGGHWVVHPHSLDQAQVDHLHTLDQTLECRSPYHR